MRLSEIEIESFRGFAERKLLPLDADVVLISGGNGTGKTSLTDAIAWCLTGELPGLAQRLKGERKGEDYVVSCYGSGPARVRLTMRDHDQTWEIERRGSASESELTITPTAALPGEAGHDLAQVFGFEHHQTLAEATHAWGILRQDSMRATLDEGSESLHRRLREILGLSALAEFESATKATSQQLGDQAAAARKELDGLEMRVRDAQTALDAAVAQQSTRELAQAAASSRLDRLRTEPIAGARLVLPAQASSSDVRQLGAQVGALARAALEVSQQLAGAPALKDAPDDDQIAALADARRRAEESLATTEARHSAQVRMAEAALGLLSEHCPVCAQPIDEQHVREHLKRLLGRDVDDAADLEAARERVYASRAALDQAQSAARRAAAARTVREQAAARWTQALADAPLLEVPSEWRGLDALEEAQSALQSVREELQTAYRELTALEHDPALAGLTAQLAELRAAQAEAREKAEGAARRAQEADGLRKAATTSAVEITEKSLTALEPAFAEVYDRLAPHPSFTHLRMVHETFYGKGRSVPRIVDPVRDIEANPNLVCSEGQLNIVALSYFLALNLETEQGGLPFAILDDPLQAMDVINVLGFCDVARALRERRQLILTTHDRRFAALLERKLTPRQEGQRTLHLEFSAWDRSGPSIEVGRPALEAVPSLLGAA